VDGSGCNTTAGVKDLWNHYPTADGAAQPPIGRPARELANAPDCTQAHQSRCSECTHWPHTLAALRLGRQ
jgi:hypothetical protein